MATKSCKRKESSAIDYWNEIVIIAILIAINAFFAAAEIALVSIRKTRLIQLRNEGHKKAKQALSLVDDPSRLLATIQVGITLAGFMASATAAVGIADNLGAWLRGFIGGYGETAAVILITLVISYFTLVLGELVPKRLALHHTERIALRVAAVVCLLAKLTKPLVWLLTASAGLVLRLFGLKGGERLGVVTEDEIRSMVEEHHELAEEEKEMIHGVFEFGDRLVSELMTHRADMICLDDATRLAEFPKFVAEQGFSRYPIYRESIDDITGYLSIKDFLVACKSEFDASRLVGGLNREVLFVPETKKASEMLRQFKEKHATLAVVVDEYGGTAGLITVEDLLEEIVGDLDDEFDQDEKMQQVNTGEIIITGRTALSEVNDLLTKDLPAGPYETIAGFCLAHLGHLPSEGETFRWLDCAFKTDEMEGRRITKVRIKRQ